MFGTSFLELGGLSTAATVSLKSKKDERTGKYHISIQIDSEFPSWYVMELTLGTPRNGPNPEPNHA
jgi:hypothetical protein